MKARLAGSLATFAATTLFAACVTIALRIAWDPPIRTYVELVPIGAVFAALVWDRLFPSRPNPRAALYDALVVALALMRAVVPPLPFASGHTLLATYSAFTACRWPLRALAVVVLAETMYQRLASGGWMSMVGGLAVAGIAAALRRRVDDTDGHPSHEFA